MSKDPVYHEGNKHIDNHFHFIRKHVKNGELKIMYLTSYMIK